jgi:hypothetical protein
MRISPLNQFAALCPLLPACKFNSLPPYGFNLRRRAQNFDDQSSLLMDAGVAMLAESTYASSPSSTIS